MEIEFVDVTLIFQFIRVKVLGVHDVLRPILAHRKKQNPTAKNDQPNINQPSESIEQQSNINNNQPPVLIKSFKHQLRIHYPSTRRQSLQPNISHHVSKEVQAILR